MPLVVSQYQSPRFLRSGHLQTVLPVFLPARRAMWQRQERLELPDGDFLDLHWTQQKNPRLAILSHGLEGSADAIYIRGMASTLVAAGWDVLAWNFRGCGGTPNRLLRSYHSGESEDLRHVVAHAAVGYPQIALIGFSLGGNITLKYLGEAPSHPAVCAAVTISVPLDLAASAKVLDGHGGNRIYLRRFLNTLIGKMQDKARQFPGQLDVTGIQNIRTIRDFDERFTAPMHGFVGAEDYWARASSGLVLESISVPTLILSARNDPLLTAECFPTNLAQSHASVHLETPAMGGHVGFMSLSNGLQPWHERRALQFLNHLK